MCLVTRACHIECDNSLDMPSFICALSRFISRRGPVKKLYSDNGSNLIGSCPELIEILENLNQDEIKDFAIANDFDWHFHAPKASSHAGHYERLIRSVRSSLQGVLSNDDVNEDNLVTLFCEVEKVLNDRPITPLSDDIKDAPPLTPNTILLLRGNSSRGLGDFDPATYKEAVAHHKHAHHLADIFWSRWIKEYVPLLQARQKALTPSRNLKVNDLVLMTGEGKKRGNGPMARIVEANPDPDGLVRTVTVLHNGFHKYRPVSKLALLEACT